MDRSVDRHVGTLVPIFDVRSIDLSIRVWAFLRGLRIPVAVSREHRIRQLAAAVTRRMVRCGARDGRSARHRAGKSSQQGEGDA